ncbi:hypothetical protein [Pelagibacterium luteolum]|uniref:Uncharacterized protein n=1 Tax=Pelagibacterium luteolum TaxID=440168 RepID=A0A1G7WGD6_9HYPH|nr:hypothetical protein [Pelagibacterium luteolum]SDG70260.1 hypothetical protein SAMN04487974_10696 [Pelagibacterium luteolum]
MNAKLLLPFAAVSMLALAACENRTEAPAVPDPDAGNPNTASEAVEDIDTTDEVMSPEELQQRREEIEAEAQQTFESIMEDTQQAGDNLVEMGNNAMDSISNSVDTASDALATQIDALVENAAEVRDDNMTDAQKLQVVTNVRNTAEEAARALGRTEAEIIAAGDSAEQRTRAVMGL